MSHERWVSRSRSPRLGAPHSREPPPMTFTNFVVAALGTRVKKTASMHSMGQREAHPSSSLTRAMGATRWPAPWPRYPPRRCGHRRSACNGSRCSTRRAGPRPLGYDPREPPGTPLWRLPDGLLLQVVVAHDTHPASACASYLTSGSRLHHWLPTSPGCPCSCCGTQFLASTPPRVAPSLWVWGSVAGCVVRCIRLPGGYEVRQGEVLRKH